jgi:hypothetical protein
VCLSANISDNGHRYNCFVNKNVLLHEIYREKFWDDEQLCKLAVGCAQQPHTEISDNMYELEEDEDIVFVEPSYGDTLEYII